MLLRKHFLSPYPCFWKLPASRARESPGDWGPHRTDHLATQGLGVCFPDTEVALPPTHSLSGSF